MTWLSEQTRPDIAIDIVNLSTNNKNLKVKDLKYLNKVVKKVSAYDVVVKYTRIGELDEMKVLTVSDASHLTQDNKTKGVAGRFIFLSSKDEKTVVPILWKSKTIAQVVKSAKAAETRSADKAVEDSIYVARSIHELYTGERGEKQIDVDLITDSKPLIDSLESTKQIDDKLLRPTIKFLKQMLDSKWLNRVRWCETKSCVADILTKSGSPLVLSVMKILETNKMIVLQSNRKTVEGGKQYQEH